MGRPWFVQFLKGQHGHGGITTLKFPSDNEDQDGGYVTKKYPSDSEDHDSGSFVTLKYPSDSDEGDFTPGQ